MNKENLEALGVGALIVGLVCFGIYWVSANNFCFFLSIGCIICFVSAFRRGVTNFIFLYIIFMIIGVIIWFFFKIFSFTW